MQDVLLQEASDLVEEFKKKVGKPFVPRNVLWNAAGNIISKLLLGQKFEQGNEGFRAVAEDLTQAVKISSKVSFESSFPVLEWFSKAWRDMKFHTDRAEAYMQNVIEDHVASHIPGEPRDFIDTWLDEEAKFTGQTKSTFDRQKMTSVLLDVFTGGFETTATSIQW